MFPGRGIYINVWLQILTFASYKKEMSLLHNLPEYMNIIFKNSEVVFQLGAITGVHISSELLIAVRFTPSAYVLCRSIYIRMREA